jgi:stress response protein YsnF
LSPNNNRCRSRSPTKKVLVDREPNTDANRGDALSGGEISGEEHELVLTAERPVVATEAVPVERVRLGTETVTEQQTVTGDIRKEQIEVDDPDHHHQPLSNPVNHGQVGGGPPPLWVPGPSMTRTQHKGPPNVRSAQRHRR